MKDTNNHSMNGNDTSNQDRLSLLFSMYSLTSSHFHSSLNTLASIIIVTNSALAFAAISRGWIEIFSSSIGLFVTSVIFYLFSVYSNFKLKNYTVHIIKNDIFELNNFIDKFENLSNISAITILLFVILSVIVFIFLDIIIVKQFLIL